MKSGAWTVWAAATIPRTAIPASDRSTATAAALSPRWPALTSDKHRLQTLKEVLSGAWDYFSVRTLYPAGEAVAEGRVFGGDKGSVPLVSPRNVDVLLARGDTLEYRIRVVYQGPLSAPVERGMPAGEIRVIGKTGIVYRAPLVTGESVARGGLFTRALDGVRELLFGWIG